MPDVLMPRLSDSMEEGTIVRWLRADGDPVRRGEEIVEIETDKATMAFEADGDGLLTIVVADGETRRVGEVIARIGANGASASAPAAPAAAPAEPRARSRDGFGASPVARRLAATLGVDLGDVRGSGPRGRILKADVARAARESTAAPASPPATALPPVPAAAAPPRPASVAADTPAGARGAISVEELSRGQAVVARRMAESKATAPDFWTSVDVDMSAVLELRAQLNGLLDPTPSLNDILLKACATALRRHPRVNGAYRDGRFEVYDRVNVGLAVAADDALIVPTIFDADQRSLGAIAAETRRLAERVRAREITPPELAGGTFTVSNLGMMGVDRFGGIINIPQAAILCAGAVTQRPVVDDEGAIVARPVMTLTLVSDHRILYGADAARFLADLKGLLQAPLAAVL